MTASGRLSEVWRVTGEEGTSGVVNTMAKSCLLLTTIDKLLSIATLSEMANDSTWRAFEQNEISHSAAHYLMTVSTFLKGGFEPRPADLARQLGISRAAVSAQVKALIAHRYLKISPNRRLALTSLGSALVDRLTGKRLLVEEFLRDFLGVSSRAAELDSCKIEHLISEETASALGRLHEILHSDVAFEKQEKKVIEKLLKKIRSKRSAT